MCQLFTELVIAREDLARAQQIEGESKQIIQQRMGEASKIANERRLAVEFDQEGLDQAARLAELK